MATIKSLRLSGLLFLVLAAAVSCNSSVDEAGLFTEPELYKLGEFTINGVTVAAYSETPPAVGYQEIFFEVHKNEVLIERPEITFTPIMHMEHHSHASPHQSPPGERDSDFGLFCGWAIFTMSSGMMGKWELAVTVHDPETAEFDIEGIIDIEVAESAMVRSFMAANGERYILTLIKPDEPRTGLNDLAVALHHRETMMQFPPVTGAAFDFEPWMPSMDHGSSNNVNPVHESEGFYHGKVNFNMTGDWELRFDINQSDEHLGNIVFAIDF